MCPYCGVGCNLTLHVQDDEIVKVTSPDDHDVTARQPVRQGPLRLRVRPEPQVMARYQILYWQDVPSVIKAFDDDGRGASASFRTGTSRRSTSARWCKGLTGSDDYLEQWHWGEIEERPGTPDEVLDAVERELDA